MNKMIVTLSALLLCVSISLAAQEPKTLRIAAGSTATDLIVTPIHDSFEKASGIHITSFKMAGKAAVAALGKGDVQAVITDATVESILADIKKGVIPFPDPSRLKSVPILNSSSVVVVHKDNPVPALSKDQLKAIFTGKTANWREVGGRDQLIVVAVSDKNKGTIAEFSRKIMDNEPLLGDPIHATDDLDVKVLVAATPEAIGILPSKTMVDASLIMPTTPEFTKTVRFFSLGDPAGDVKTLLDYLLGPGRILFIH